jgi:pimeloyl-ACP methyl ester carboxylesterase
MIGKVMGRLADRLILCPTNHAIQVSDKSCRYLKVGRDRVEIWIQEVGPVEREVDLCVLKFVGTGGRAECSTDQPACYWPTFRTRLWTVNPPGYGGSSGQASIQKLAPTARVVFEELMRRADGLPIVVFGNSLGGTCALHLAARYKVDGLILRNPPPLREMILGRFAWRSCYLGAWLIARQVPKELDCRANAGRATAPAVFVMSAQDTTVPPKYQRLIHEAYGGTKEIVVLENAGHAGPFSPEAAAAYQRALERLWSSIVAARRPA